MARMTRPTMSTWLMVEIQHIATRWLLEPWNGLHVKELEFLLAESSNVGQAEVERLAYSLLRAASKSRQEHTSIPP